MSIYSFEKLDVWRKSCLLAKEIYLITNKYFPQSEKYGLSSQIRRSSISVSSNIAEGTSRNSGKEQARFTNIAYGSLMEVLSQILIVRDLNYIDETHYLKIRKMINTISSSLCKLRDYQQSKNVKPFKP